MGNCARRIDTIIVFPLFDVLLQGSISNSFHSALAHRIYQAKVYLVKAGVRWRVCSSVYGVFIIQRSLNINHGLSDDLVV